MDGPSDCLNRNMKAEGLAIVSVVYINRVADTRTTTFASPLTPRVPRARFCQALKKDRFAIIAPLHPCSFNDRRYGGSGNDTSSLPRFFSARSMPVSAVFAINSLSVFERDLRTGVFDSFRRREGHRELEKR